MDISRIEERVKSIAKVLDLEKLDLHKSAFADVKKYYTVNKIPYTYFHTKTDFVHMAVSSDGVYRENDLQFQVKQVAGYVQELGVKRVLELGTGRGANSYFLARQFTECLFDGIDITPAHIHLALQKARVVRNYTPQLGDYHDLSRYSEGLFDVVFEFESLCYSKDKFKVLSEVSRVLKPGGYFIVFDGFRTPQLLSLPALVQRAYKIMSLAMAVEDFGSTGDLIHDAEINSLSLMKEQDLSKRVMPTLNRFNQYNSSELCSGVGPCSHGILQVWLNI